MTILQDFHFYLSTDAKMLMTDMVWKTQPMGVRMVHVF